MAKSGANQPTESFDNGQIVWLRVNTEVCGMVTGILTRPGGLVQYLVGWSENVEEKCHFACELSSERLISYGTDT